MECVPATLLHNAALVIDTDVYLPGPRVPGGHAFRLNGTRAPVELSFTRRLPFPAAGLAPRHWLAINEQAEDDETVARSLVMDVIRQYRRSREHGLPYDQADEGSAVPELTDEELLGVIGDPTLLWFGWTWRLVPDPEGTVRCNDRRMMPVSPAPFRTWWDSINARCREMMATQLTGLGTDMGSELAEWDPDMQENVMFFNDDSVSVSWNGNDREFQFAIRFGRFALGDKERRVYSFPPGAFVVRGTVDRLAQFARTPDAVRLPNRVVMRSSDIRHPCVDSTDRSLCTGGGLETVHNSGFSPAGIILLSLEMGIQVLHTGLGPNGPIVYRDLSRSGAPSMSEREAKERGVNFIPWRYSERGMTEVLEP